MMVTTNALKRTLCIRSANTIGAAFAGDRADRQSSLRTA